MITTTTQSMVYLLTDQRIGPYVAGVGALLADVMREVKEAQLPSGARSRT